MAEYKSSKVRESFDDNDKQSKDNDINESIINNYCGFLSKPKNPDDLASKLKILIDILNNSQSIITNNKLSFSESSIDNINDYEIISKLDYLHKNINVLKISGFYEDKWCARDFSLKYSCKEDFATINIKIFNPSDSESSIKIRHNDNLIEHFVKRGESNILIESKSFADKHNNLIVNSNLNNNVEDDERDLSFIISDMVFK